MANPDHLDKLCQGPKVWNEWRRENPDIVPDLSQATLGLNQRQFGPSNGGPIDLRAANLEGAMLRFATLTEADLEGARLIGADLMHARLDRAKLIAADLTDTMLDHADLTGADLTRTIITGASFVNARNLTQMQIEDAFGDATTLLPASLTPPQCWFPAFEDEDAYANYDPDEEEEEDLYEILGLDKTASAEEIRSSYRALVKKLHPDLNPDDKPAQELFKKVSTAYRILNDPEKRAAYDTGEIDGEGRVRPEYEAEQQFRKYAYRFYAAAVMSVFLAVGALAFAWNAVLRNHDGDNRATVAIAAPKQQNERLNIDPAPKRTAKLEIDETKAEAMADRAGLGNQESSSQGPSELEKGMVVPSAKELQPAAKANTAPAAKPDTTDNAAADAKAETPAIAAPPAPAASTPPAGEPKAVETASAEATTPPGPEASQQPPQPQQQQLALRSEGSASPLAEDHKGDEAGATQSPSAGTVTPETEVEAHRTQPNYAALSETSADRTGSDGAANARGQNSAKVPPARSNTVSSALRDRAISHALAKQEPEETGSIAGQTDARPEAGGPSAVSPSAPRAMRAHRRRGYAYRRQPRRMIRTYYDGPDYVEEEMIRAPRGQRERLMRDRNSEQRRQAVTDILMGGP